MRFFKLDRPVGICPPVRPHTYQIIQIDYTITSRKNQHVYEANFRFLTPLIHKSRAAENFPRPVRFGSVLKVYLPLLLLAITAREETISRRPEMPIFETYPPPVFGLKSIRGVMSSRSWRTLGLSSSVR